MHVLPQVAATSAIAMLDSGLVRHRLLVEGRTASLSARRFANRRLGRRGLQYLRRRTDDRRLTL